MGSGSGWGTGCVVTFGGREEKVAESAGFDGLMRGAVAPGGVELCMGAPFEIGGV